ncbi:MAG: mycothiol system anti-sigma-R factor [Dermatophilaceae bacterium]
MTGDVNEADCSEALHRVFEYLDGEMAPEDHVKIATHLAHCVRCLEQYDVDTMVKALVKRSCPPEPAPARLRMTIVQSITSIEIRYTD